eukprot:331503_1
MLKIIHHYKHLFVVHIRMNPIKDDQVMPKREIRQNYTSYLTWDNMEIREEIKKELVRSENSTALVQMKTGGDTSTSMHKNMRGKLYNVSVWTDEPVKIRKRKRRKRNIVVKKETKVPQQNRYKSSWIKKKKLIRKKKYEHGKRHHAIKKHKKRQNRIHTKLDTVWLFEG